MEKALVHSSPSSASILLIGGVNLDRSRAVQPKPRKPGQGFVSQDLPVAN